MKCSDFQCLYLYNTNTSIENVFYIVDTNASSTEVRKFLGNFRVYVLAITESQMQSDARHTCLQSVLPDGIPPGSRPANQENSDFACSAPAPDAQGSPGTPSTL